MRRRLRGRSIRRLLLAHGAGILLVFIALHPILVSVAATDFDSEGGTAEHEKKDTPNSGKSNVRRCNDNDTGNDMDINDILDFVRGGGGEASAAPKKTVDTKDNNNAPPPHVPPPRPVIVTVPKYGKIEGRRESSVDVYRGIPYASPPVGSLRFAPPEPPPPWHPAQLDASSYGPDCWQIADAISNPLADANNMSEDCLYLNVFTPAGQAARSKGGTKHLLPVMIWFHGGAFQQGGANRPEFDGPRLADRGVLVVTVNYRLGALGFLVSSKDGLYGNLGLMDQRAALDWVHSEIRYLGGDPNAVTLFGESAGAVMIGLHLINDGAGTLFQRAIMQSNPLGYTFRSVVVADFLGQALKHSVDCRDLACLRAERVEEIVRAQAGLMGVPRSVGDFFTWGPVLTTENRVDISLVRGSGVGNLFSRSSEHRLPRLDNDASRGFVAAAEWRRLRRDLDEGSARWAAVNVSQPLDTLSKIPDSIPIIIGSNKHEGEIFVHSAFPAPMNKAVYWMFVGALFRDSATRVLKHYRSLVEDVERKAQELARLQIEEEEAKQRYQCHRDKFNSIHDIVRQRREGNVRKENERKKRRKGRRGREGFPSTDRVVRTWSDGYDFTIRDVESSNDDLSKDAIDFRGWISSPSSYNDWMHTHVDKASLRAHARAERRAARQRAKRLRDAAKVKIDYRPVLSRILGDYLFRCPTWHYAQLLSERRERRRRHENNIFVYRFSQPTHIPGYEECWGKSCHTAELPYVFASMDVLHSNYSVISPYAEREAPSPPEYPYSDLARIVEESNRQQEKLIESNRADDSGMGRPGRNHTPAFQRVIKHFCGQYLLDTDEELATDMVNRWSSFALMGSPNFDGSKMEWHPWRYRPSRVLDHKTTDIYKGSIEDLWPDECEWDSDDEREWTDYSEGNLDTDNDEGYANYGQDVDSDSRHQAATLQYYRRRALEALQLEEASEEDPFRTELKRIKQRACTEGSTVDRSIAKKIFPWLQEDSQEVPMSRDLAKDLIQRALDAGALGRGLSRDAREQMKTQDFLPELLELSWPPEGRLIEGDCSCDLWDEITYRY